MARMQCHEIPGVDNGGDLIRDGTLRGVIAGLEKVIVYPDCLRHHGGRPEWDNN